MTDQPAQNTDREIWRKVPGDYYSPSIHVTEDGRIGIEVGGHVIVRSVEMWHALVSALTKVNISVKRHDD